MAKYQVHYTETEERSIIVEAESEDEALEKCDDFLSGDSEESYLPKREEWYEFNVAEAVKIKE